jgi:hypothetical protein
LFDAEHVGEIFRTHDWLGHFDDPGRTSDGSSGAAPQGYGGFVVDRGRRYHVHFHFCSGAVAFGAGFGHEGDFVLDCLAHSRVEPSRVPLSTASRGITLAATPA